MRQNFKGDKLNEFLEKDIPPIEWYIENIIIKAGLTYCYGAPGSFKTNFMLYAMLNASQGKNVFNFEVKEKLNILWIDEENRDRGMHDKLSKITKGIKYNGNESGEFILLYHNNFDILNSGDIMLLDEYIKDYKINIVVIDSIAKVFSEDEIDKKKVKKIFSNLKPLMIKYGVSFILLHHSRKLQHGYGKSLHEISGSHEFAAQCDDLLNLEYVFTKDDKKTFCLSSQKPRYTIGIPAVNFEVHGDGEMFIEYKGLAKDNIQKRRDERKDSIKQAVLQWLLDNPEKEYQLSKIMSKLKNHCKCGDTQIRQAIYQDDDSLDAEGVIKYDFGKFKFLEGEKEWI